MFTSTTSITLIPCLVVRFTLPALQVPTSTQWWRFFPYLQPPSIYEMRMGQGLRRMIIRFNLESTTLLLPPFSRSTMSRGSSKQLAILPESVSPPSVRLFVCEIVDALYLRKLCPCLLELSSLRQTRSRTYFPTSLRRSLD
ncbi:hypothetical protein K469DRAFT_211727 [Zopfia rhizophila CBS 207.26]|uniref:Secreted protein n=1 Tax=Zopfia rhizophila CBS 207.26 TaxID=1314779 RepID=A0A6A6DWL5_9PEZI|nr:hypothetical protein K469DRAFT_211727 [Zopfia rhizophila CBS 207.26]